MSAQVPAAAAEGGPQPVIRRFLVNYGIVIAYALLFIAFSFITPNFLKTSNLTTLLLQIVATGLLAIGMQFVILTGEIDLSVGEIEALAGMVAAGALAGHLPWPIVLGAGLLSGVVVGAVNGFATAYLRMPSFIVTLATMSVAEGAAYVYSNGMVMSNGFTASFDAIGQGFIGPLPVPVILMLILFGAGYFVLRYTAYGRQVYAAGGNRTVAWLSGINTQLVVASVFVIAGALSALSGMITAARLSAALPTIGGNDNLNAIAAVIIGGTSFLGGEGSILGALVGALLVGTLIDGLTLMNVNYYVQLMIEGGVILAAVLLNQGRH